MQEPVGRFARADRSPPVPASPRVRSTEAYPRTGVVSQFPKSAPLTSITPDGARDYLPRMTGLPLAALLAVFICVAVAIFVATRKKPRA
jgi:hypothetical protein